MADCNVEGTEVLEDITSTKATEQTAAAAELNDSAAKEIADRPLHSDPVSPATAVPKKGVDLPVDDEPKVILNLEIAKLNQNGNDKDAAESSVATEIETVRISNADSSNEIAASKEIFLHNNRISHSLNSSDEDENFEVVEIIGMPVADMKSSPTRKNPLADVTNDELLAILEGDVDSTTAKADEDGDEANPTVVFEIIDVPEEERPALDDDDIKNIAREQMNSMKAKRRGRPPSSQKPALKVSELVSSLVSEWSDTEKDPDPEKPAPKSTLPVKEATLIKKNPVIQIVKKPTPVVTPFKPTRIIKKKIIWDPDAPETQISYASLVKSTVTPRKRQSSASKSSAGSTSSEPMLPISHTKPKPDIHVAFGKSKMEHIPLLKSKPDPPPSTTTQYQPKMRILNSAKRSSPSPPLIAHNKRKRVSEIDKLLNDEGAANMLNTLETVEKPAAKEPRAKKTLTPVPVKKETTPRKRGGPRSSASSSWDYVYNQRNVDSLIIRRRSNSSYSSTTSPRRSSVEKKKLSNPRSTKSKMKSFEFAKPETKKMGKKSPGGPSETLLVDDIKKAETRDSLRKSSRTPIPTESKDSAPVADRSAPEAISADEVTIKRHGAVVQMILKPKMEKVKNTFTAQLMNEVVRLLNILETDNTCKILVITSVGPNFCQGVDFLAITQGSAEKRKNAALELADSVTSFLQALLCFSKPLIAGIVGSCSGIGVTMLPLFDIVVCSDKSTFETPYAKMGQLPEGHCILTATNNIRHTFKMKLLWLCDKLSSTEAALSGLVCKLTAPSKVIEETLMYAKRTAMLSQQALVSLKAQRHDLKNLTAILKDEKKILAGQWQTIECQDKFKQFIANGHW